MTEQYFLAVVQLYIVCFFAFYRIVILQGDPLIVGKGVKVVISCLQEAIRSRSTTVDIKFVL